MATYNYEENLQVTTGNRIQNLSPPTINSTRMSFSFISFLRFSLFERVVGGRGGGGGGKNLLQRSNLQPQSRWWLRNRWFPVLKGLPSSNIVAKTKLWATNRIWDSQILRDSFEIEFPDGMAHPLPSSNGKVLLKRSKKGRQDEIATCVCC